MAKGGGGQTFPVVFMYGETEINIGTVEITPTVQFKQLHTMLSQKIGLLHNQIFVYLVDHKRSPKSVISNERGTIPMIGTVNFDVISRKKDHYFVVVLKKPRKSRNQRERTTNAVESAGELPDTKFPPPSTYPVRANPILLHRNQTMPFNNRIAQVGLDDLNDRLQNLRIHRENYEMAIAKESATIPTIRPDPYPISNVDSFPVVSDVYRVTAATRMMMRNKEAPKTRCVECVKSRGRSTTSFHPCVNDAVVTRFTTRAGPISGPERNSFHDSFGWWPLKWKGFNPLWPRMFCT